MARGSQLYGDHGYYARMEEKFQTLAVPSTTATTPRDGSSASQEGEGAFVTAAAIANAAILPTALASGNASGDEEEGSDSEGGDGNGDGDDSDSTTGSNYGTPREDRDRGKIVPVVHWRYGI